MSGERTLYLEDELVPLVRAGFLEDCYFTYSYSPVYRLGRTRPPG